MQILEETIKNKKPSLSLEQINQYNILRDNFEGIAEKKPERKPIGFK